MESDVQLRSEPGRPLEVHCQVVTYPVDELQQHRSYVLHHPTVPASKLSALAAQDDRVSQEPIATMSAGLDFPPIRSSSAVEVISAVPPQSFNPAEVSRLEGRPVVRSPEQLRMHRELEEFDWVGTIGELSDAARLTSPTVTDPILITTNGTILAGFGSWRSAVFDGGHEISCIEYPLSEDEALQFIISHHQPQRGWNAFIRIRLALKLEPYFQQRALDNMRAGGKYKGLADLPEARHIDVRQEIAHAAGVGARNVSNVKTILKNVHSRLITALLNGTLTINGAMKFCKLPRAAQLERFIRHCEDRETGKVIRRAIGRLKEKKISPDAGAVLDCVAAAGGAPTRIRCGAGRSVSTHGNSYRSGYVDRTVFSKGARPR